jgi:predicted DNA-binding transcriptional regulator AlpA
MGRTGRTKPGDKRLEKLTVRMIGRHMRALGPVGVNMAAKKLYSMSSASDLLDIAESTLWQWWQDGRFPKGTKYGPKQRRWSEEEIATWQEQRQAAAQERAA